VIYFNFALTLFAATPNAEGCFLKTEYYSGGISAQEAVLNTSIFHSSVATPLTQYYMQKISL
jgi:hypothetical protein